MTLLQEVLFEMRAPYFGHPYYVTGNALYNAVARRVGAEVRRALHVSTGVFVPGEYGSYPAEHSRAGGVPYMGAGLRPVEAYADLFLVRDAAQRWLSDTRPREAHNTHGWECHGERVAVAPRTRFGRPPESRYSRRSMTWFVHCYLHADGDAGVVPLGEDVLDGIRVGGARNYGLGELGVKETRTVELDALEFGVLRDAAEDDEECWIELVSPFVVASEVPGADAQSVPWWWDTVEGSVAAAASLEGLRRRRERVVVDGESYVVEVIDHGQVVAYAGDDPVATARNGVRRVGTHRKLGFGEFRVVPAGRDRVPERRRGTRSRARPGSGSGSGSGSRGRRGAHRGGGSW